MVQFHATVLIAGSDTRMTGTIIEEGLRGFGGYLLGGDEQRFMHKYDERNERATRDIVSRAMFTEMRAGNVAAHGGLYITMKHLDTAQVRKNFKGMVERCADCGFDLAAGLVEVVPTAHYMMGGAEFEADCSTAIPGLFAAGEDTGGVHGANRLGGNGVANSTVFGGIAGDTIARWTPDNGQFADPDPASLEDAVMLAGRPLTQPKGDIDGIRKRLYDLMWEDAGIIRDLDSLKRAAEGLDVLEHDLDQTGVTGTDLAYNLTWHDWLNLKNLILVSKAITAAATARDDSRGAHYRADYPDVRDVENSRFTRVTLDGHGQINMTTEPVKFTRVKPGETLLDETAAE
ncbi:MAG: FAD-binding protein [Rhodospirillales bacterium]